MGVDLLNHLALIAAEDAHRQRLRDRARIIDGADAYVRARGWGRMSRARERRTRLNAAYGLPAVRQDCITVEWTRIARVLTGRLTRQEIQIAAGRLKLRHADTCGCRWYIDGPAFPIYPDDRPPGRVSNLSYTGRCTCPFWPAVREHALAHG